MMVHATSYTGALLSALASGPKTNAELVEVIDEIPQYVSRTMAKLRERGLALNRNAGQKKALYEITPLGRALLERAAA